MSEEIINVVYTDPELVKAGQQLMKQRKCAEIYNLTEQDNKQQNTMKNKSFKAFIIMLAIGILAGCLAHAQETIITNPVEPMPSFSSGLQQVYDSFTSSTNFAFAAGGGRSTTGNRNLAFADLAYNFNQNVDLIIGYDYLSQPHASQVNLVKGGINLQADLKPFKSLGFPNFTVTPFGFGLVATGDGTVSEILGGGVKTVIYSFKGFNVNVGVLYEKRTGDGIWNGEYLGGFFALSKGI